MNTKHLDYTGSCVNNTEYTEVTIFHHRSPINRVRSFHSIHLSEKKWNCYFSNILTVVKSRANKKSPFAKTNEIIRQIKHSSSWNNFLGSIRCFDMKRINMVKLQKCKTICALSITSATTVVFGCSTHYYATFWLVPSDDLHS